MKKNTIHLSFDVLEDRNCPTIGVRGHALLIGGTNGADRISVNYSNHHHKIRAVVHHLGHTEVKTVQANRINRVIINGKGGNDLIVNNTNKPSIIFAGRGNDRIFGGSGNDRLNGGPGNDRIFGRNGNDTLYGGNGSDLLNGGCGNDFLNGGCGKDFLFTGAGFNSWVNDGLDVIDSSLNGLPCGALPGCGCHDGGGNNGGGNNGGGNDDDDDGEHNHHNHHHHGHHYGWHHNHHNHGHHYGQFKHDDE